MPDPTTAVPATRTSSVQPTPPTQSGSAETPDDAGPTLVAQVNALIDYVAERGLLADETGSNASSQTGLKQRTTQLAQALGEYQDADNPTERRDKRLAVLLLYSDLTRVTGGVTGRSIIDTANIQHHLRPLFIITGVFLIFALGATSLQVWLASSQPPPGSGWLLAGLVDIQRYVLNYLSPFFWGGVGACVYLLKNLSDKARAKTFDTRDLQGWVTRIFLGAILGSVVRYVYAPFKSDVSQIDANAVAFFTGIGIKVIYGAIEKTIEQLAEKFNLDTARKDAAQDGVIRAYLEQRLARFDPDKQASQREVLLQLIDELNRPAPKA